MPPEIELGTTTSASMSPGLERGPVNAKVPEWITGCATVWVHA